MTRNEVTSLDEAISIMENTVAEIDNGIGAGQPPVYAIKSPEGRPFAAASLNPNINPYPEEQSGDLGERLVDNDPFLAEIESSIIFNKRLEPELSNVEPSRKFFRWLSAHEYGHHISHKDSKYIERAFNAGIVEFKLMAAETFDMLPRYKDDVFELFKRLNENELLIRLPTKGAVINEIETDENVNERFAQLFGTGYSDMRPGAAATTSSALLSQAGLF